MLTFAEKMAIIQSLLKELNFTENAQVCLFISEDKRTLYHNTFSPDEIPINPFVNLLKEKMQKHGHVNVRTT